MVEHANVNAKHLGVAQDRRRFIATAVRKGFQSHVKMAAKALGATVTCVADVLPGKTGEGVWHYSRDNKSPCLRRAEDPYPALRPNGGYFPRPGTYKGRKGDEGDIQDCVPMSVADLATLQGWPKEAHHALPAGRNAAVRILG